MAGNMTTPHAIEVAKDEVSETPYSPPATWYVGILTVITSATVPTVTECSDAAYARQPVSAWDAVDASAHTSNTAQINWAAATTGFTVKGYGLYTAISGGVARYVKAV